MPDKNEGPARLGMREYMRRWRQRHPGYHAGRVRERDAFEASRYRADVAFIIRAYGGKCACCGESARQFLTIDHVDGDGAAERSAAGGHTASLRRLAKRIITHGLDARFQVLCWNCNCARSAWGYCHERPAPAVEAQLRLIAPDGDAPAPEAKPSAPAVEK